MDDRGVLPILNYVSADYFFAPKTATLFLWKNNLSNAGNISIIDINIGIDTSIIIMLYAKLIVNENRIFL